MGRVEELKYRTKVIIKFYCDNAKDKALTVRHFSEQSMDRSVIYRIINRFEERGTIDFRPKTGRPRTQVTENLLKKVDRTLQRDPGLSIRALAKKLNISKTSATRAKKEAGYASFKCISAPKTSPEQEKRIITGASRLYKKLVPSGGAKIIVMDDESYFPCDPKQVTGPKFYSEKKDCGVEIQHKIKPKLKFFKKFMVWQAIDIDGNVSEPFIFYGTMDAETYLEECLKKRLLPFIHKHHRPEQVLFWPDMATSHYARSVVSWLRDQDFGFVERNENTPNFPQGRGIELFWGLIKREYAKRTQVTKSLTSFKRIYTNISQSVAQKSGKNLMQGTKRKLRLARDEGPLSLLNIKLPPLKASNKANNQ